ncbi:unnamed protein product [Musa hybrid cultivar]
MTALGRVGRTLFRTVASVSTDSSSNLTSTLGASTPNLQSPSNILQIHCNTVMGTFDMAEDYGFDLHLQRACCSSSQRRCMRSLAPVTVSPTSETGWKLRARRPP